MSAPEKTIRLTIDLTYNAESMHGDDAKAIEWFQGILSGDNLQLGEFFDLGDMIGTVKGVDCTPSHDERVARLVEAASYAAREIQDYIDDDTGIGPLEDARDTLRAALRDMGVE